MRNSWLYDEDDNQHTDRWLVSYADYMTLMFALFVVLYSLSLVNEEKYSQLSTTLGEVFSGQQGEKTGVHGDGLLTTNTEATTEIPRFGDSLKSDRGPELVDGKANLTTIASQRRGNPLENIDQELQTALYEDIEAGRVKLIRDEDWLMIEFDSAALFPSGSATLTNRAKSIIAKVLPELGKVSNYLRVRGYTDDQAIATEIYQSNWQLSVARATEVVMWLEQQDIAPQRLAVEGYGQYSPFVTNSTEQSRAQNRKVVLALSKYGYQPSMDETASEVAPSVAEQPLGNDAKAGAEIKVIPLENGNIRITTREENSEKKPDNN